MKLAKLGEMTGGWFVGNFEPSILRSEHFEACVKYYAKGATEAGHYQLLATEITVIVSGAARMGNQVLNAGDVVLLEPFEIADFEALTDVALVALKSPSMPDDKVLA